MPQRHETIARTFVKRLTASVGLHRELLIAVHLKKHQSSLETMLVEQFVMSSVVLWEVFLNDLLLAHLSESPDAFLADLKARMLASMKERYGSNAVRYSVVTFPQQISPALAAGLVDPKNFNLTASSADALTLRANRVLAAAYAKKFTLPADDAQFLDFALAMRNYLAHRSPSSRSTLKSTMLKLAGPNADLAGPLGDVGTYLKRRNGSEDTRSIVLAMRFADLATLLA